MKDTKCKCSHLKSEHKGSCTVCQCSSYLRFDRPNNYDMFGVITGIISMILVCAISAVIISMDPHEMALDIITVNNFALLLKLIGILMATFIILIWLPTISIYLKEKKRKNWN